MDEFYCTIFWAWQIVSCHKSFMFFPPSPLPLWILQHPLFYFHLTNGFHVRAYTSIIVSNESRIDLHTVLTSALPEGHSLWLDACPCSVHMVCSCNVYIPWVLYSCERHTPADSSNMPEQVCGQEISRLLPAFKVRLTEKHQKKVWRTFGVFFTYCLASEDLIYHITSLIDHFYVIS